MSKKSQRVRLRIAEINNLVEDVYTVEPTASQQAKVAKMTNGELKSRAEVCSMNSNMHANNPYGSQYRMYQGELQAIRNEVKTRKAAGTWQ